ncbi:excisionase [Agrobacterium sp. ATCC 31749]|uniref:helix-turn-helix domain-containing protein n=1 Tax=unclassified Agrobacterium TaxID=2632611 RepID=UPI00020DB4D7|nr:MULTISPECIES: helix-turn-helix domain-containing protein [unclassified Agrobacterium]EGL64212.1 excisionase [Agrobacterium sp. ATCC 31749]QKW99418.1 helix-turn-helix domain-containing protein [Agrobacterium sp. CGMCC 11546]
MDDDIITIREVAEYLRLREKTTYALAAKGELPGFKVGGSWRFRKSALEKWIVQREGNEASRS